MAGLLSVAAISTAATLLLTATAARALMRQENPVLVPSPPPAAAAAAEGAGRGFRLTSGPAAAVLFSLSFLAAAGPLALTR